MDPRAEAAELAEPISDLRLVQWRNFARLVGPADEGGEMILAPAPQPVRVASPGARIGDAGGLGGGRSLPRKLPMSLVRSHVAPRSAASAAEAERRVK